jgi:succinyl-CoA synthetase beta subunit/citryl-CoA synthetase large subunit
VFSLTEDRTKQWLAKAGLPVPGGAAAGTAAEAVKIASGFSGGAVVKALVPTGRRGKADAVRLVATAEEAGTAAEALLGTEVNGYPVARVYVEERVADAIVTADIDPLAGVDADGAAALWRDAGVDATLLPKLGDLTAGLYKAFVAADAAMLELNPIAVTDAGALSLVGAMMGVDENGLPRHEDWAEEADGSLIAAWRRFNERELRVAEANRTIKGGAIRYTELDGDIALLVGGGGAGLLQHDMMLAMGGRPANHTDTNPGAGIEEKFRVVVRSILDNPQAKCLLVSFNHQQLTRCDRKVIPLLDVLRERNVDAEKFPIMIRLVGPGEEEARALAAEYPGIIYLPTDASLDDAVRKAVEVCNGLTAKGAAQ